jgi:hypothetical protein
MRHKNKLGMTLLAAWLVATGVLYFLKLPAAQTGMIMAILAIAAGALIYMEK